MTPVNLADLKIILPPGPGLSAKRPATNSSSEYCMRTLTSWLSGSLFFSRKPIASYVTLPG